MEPPVTSRRRADAKLVALRVGHHDPTSGVLFDGVVDDAAGTELLESSDLVVDGWHLDVEVHAVPADFGSSTR
jgi:hypothetical protein